MQQDLKRCTRCKSEKQKILVDHTKDSNTGLKVTLEAGILLLLKGLSSQLAPSDAPQVLILAIG